MKIGSGMKIGLLLSRSGGTAPGQRDVYVALDDREDRMPITSNRTAPTNEPTQPEA